MNGLINYLTIENTVFFVVALAIIVCGSVLVLKLRAKAKEKKMKENASSLDVEKHLNQFFKVREIEEEKNIALLSSDPTREYSSGTGTPAWFKLENVPAELKFEGKVLKVTNEGPGGTIKIVPVRYDMLPTEKETLLLAEARKTKALELEKAKKTA